ncbi:sugar ABC transporter permease [Labrys miyagiensis]
MATQQTRVLARVAVAPSVLMLFLWMIVPLVLTIWYSLNNYTLDDPTNFYWNSFANYKFFLTDPAFIKSFVVSLEIVLSVLVITVVGGILIALLMDQPFVGQSIVRLMVLAPFFVMPTVAALIWKNLFMNADGGILTWVSQVLHLPVVVWFTNYPLLSIIIIVAWQWLPFATLILLTAIQSLDEEQKEASQLDGAKPLSYFFYIVLPHLSRAITVVILIETIFLLNIFAEIKVTTNGSLGTANLPFLVYLTEAGDHDIGSASAGALVAVVLANIVAFFLIRMIGKNLEA